MITTHSRCCFSLSSNKQLRHRPQDTRSQTTQEMNTTRAYNRHDTNQPQSSIIFLMTSFNNTIPIVPSTSHQRHLHSIISRSKVSVVRSRSPPFWISSRKHFTSTSCPHVCHINIYVLQDRSQTHLSIYLLISLIRSEKTFATSLKSMTFHAIYPILSTSLIEDMMDIYFSYIMNKDQNICIFST